jgi:hypothetical protein
VDLVPVLDQIDVMFRDLSSCGAGYWQIRMRTDPSGAVFEIMLGEGLPDPGRLPAVVNVRLGMAPGRSTEPAPGCLAADRRYNGQPAGRPVASWQGKPPPLGAEPVQLRSAEGGRVALVRCHGSPGPGEAANGNVAALTALCQWLSALHSRDLLIPAGVPGRSA